MPSLLNPKHETFARTVASGCTKTDAAIAAGYSKTDAGKRGWKLTKIPNVAARIEELQQRGARQTAMQMAKITAASEKAVDEQIATALGNGPLQEAIGTEKEISRAVNMAIACRVQRVAWLDDRARRMRRVIEERAVDPKFAKAPGGTTGLLVVTFQKIGTGKTAKLIPEYAVDTGLLKELRATEQQAAQELGQWTEKRELTGEDGEAFKLVISPVEANL